MSLTYRRLETREEYETALEVQKNVWGMEDIEILPVHFMIAYRDYGEQWGAFDYNKMVSILLSYPCGDSHYLMHMLGTIPEYRGKGIGEKLMKHVKQRLIERGQNFLVWTYDPLDFANAHLYHNKIGSIGYKVAFDYYGRLRSKHHGELPTHRLFCFWSLSEKPKNGHEIKEVKIPASLEEMKKMSMELAFDNSAKYFKQINDFIEKGYVVTGFNKEKKALILSQNVSKVVLTNDIL